MDKVSSTTPPDDFDRLMAAWQPANEAHAGLKAGAAFNKGLAYFAKVYDAHWDDLVRLCQIAGYGYPGDGFLETSNG